MEKIAVIVGKMHTGGKKNLIMEYYRHIDRQKVQFDFICDSDSNAIPKEEIEKLGGRVFLVPPYQNIVANVVAIMRLCKKNKYRIVHGYNGTMNVFAMFAAWCAGVPIRINESISMAHKSDKKTIIKNMLKPFSGSFSTHYMANGESCGKWQFGKDYDEGKVAIFKTVINTNENRYNADLRETCRNQYCIEKDSVVVGHIGRFTAQKNTLFVIDIFAEIARMDKMARFIIIGHGELHEQMLKRIREKNIEDKVINVGMTENIRPFYNAMDAFLLPSLYEGLPVVGVEAECCGLPVFFSSEIPKESSPCEKLGFFLELDKTAEEWAQFILEKVERNKRTDYSVLVKNAGFDSINEAGRLVDYYLGL